MRKILVFLVLTISAVVYADGHGDSPCAHDDDLAACLEHIREVAYDDESFFFGSSYLEKCLYDWVSVDCVNMKRQWNDSIISLMYGPNSTDVLDDLDRQIHVEFHSMPFNYSGCGTNMTWGERTFQLDASMNTISPVYARDMPEMSWDYEEGEYFTLLILDPAFTAVHGIATNIPGDDLSMADIINDYGGPLNFRFVPNPYVWLLYKQENGPGLVVADKYFMYMGSQNFTTNVPMFQQENNLKGPIAFNMLLASTDVYAVDMLRILTGGNLIQNCAAFVEEALEKEELPFLPEDVQLTAFLNVTMHTGPTSYFYCCEEHYIEEDVVTLDPISGKYLNASSARDESMITVMVTPNTVPPQIYNYLQLFSSQSFVMLAVDVDVPNPDFATRERPLLHYFAYNVRLDPVSNNQAVINDGVTLINWSGPKPPDSEPHTYYMMLFAMNEEFYSEQDAALGLYTGEDCGNRCMFDIERYVQEKGLDLLGASWFRTKNDMYVNYLWNVPESDVCPPMWDSCASPEITDGASMGTPMMSSIVLAALVGLQMWL